MGNLNRLLVGGAAVVLGGCAFDVSPIGGLETGGSGGTLGPVVAVGSDGVAGMGWASPGGTMVPSGVVAPVTGGSGGVGASAPVPVPDPVEPPVAPVEPTPVEPEPVVTDPVPEPVEPEPDPVPDPTPDPVLCVDVAPLARALTYPGSGRVLDCEATAPCEDGVTDPWCDWYPGVDAPVSCTGYAVGWGYPFPDCQPPRDHCTRVRDEADCYVQGDYAVVQSRLAVGGYGWVEMETVPMNGGYCPLRC